MPRLKSVLNGKQCPECLVGEDHPNRPGAKLVRDHVLYHDGMWWSQCLVCAGLWDKHLQYSPQTYSESKGWFKC